MNMKGFGTVRKLLGQRGLTLIELLVSLVVIASGIFVLLATFNALTRQGYRSEQNAAAVQVAHSVLEELRKRPLSDSILVDRVKANNTVKLEDTLRKLSLKQILSNRTKFFDTVWTPYPVSSALTPGGPDARFYPFIRIADDSTGLKRIEVFVLWKDRNGKTEVRHVAGTRL